MLVLPSKKLTVPAAVLGVTLAVNVRLAPTAEGDGPLVRARLVLVAVSVMPVPAIATICVLPVTFSVLSVNVSEAGRGPGVAGVKVTV